MPSDDVLVLIDEGGRVVEWGRPAEELFGWSADEAVGQCVTAIMREVAADDGWRRERVPDAAAGLVKPVLRGTSVVLQVLAARGPTPGPALPLFKPPFTHSPRAQHA